ncbi:MAG: LEA type 2 family protein [Thermodesulfobacteriota bacterium]
MGPSTGKFRFLRAPALWLALTIMMSPALTGCAKYWIKKAIENCEVRVEGVQVSEDLTGLASQVRDLIEAILGGTGSARLPENQEPDLSLILSIKNNNDFAFTLEALDLDLYLGGPRVAQGRLDPARRVFLGPSETARAELPLDVSLARLLSGAGSTVSTKKITWRVAGRMMVSTSNRRLEVPVDLKGDKLPFVRIEVEKPPTPGPGGGEGGLPPGTMVD